jgi:hypothetical protein
VAARRKIEPSVKLEPYVKMPNGGVAPRCQYVRHAGQKRPHTQCEKPSKKGGDRCVTHGARLKARIGPLNPNWKGGVTPPRRDRYSSRFTGPMAESYLAALDDPKILSLEDEIALVDTFLGDAIGKAQEPRATAEEIKARVEALTFAMQSGEPAAMREALVKLNDLARGEVNIEAARAHVMKLTERRRRLVESERKHLVEQRMFLSIEQARAYGSALLEAVIRNVKDKNEVARVVADFRIISTAGRDPIGRGALDADQRSEDAPIPTKVISR